MITLFTIPKPFTDPHIRIIQRNAIKGWKKLGAGVEVILLGNEAGVRETALEFGVTHIPAIELSKWGTPLINSAFDLARNVARNDLLMYVNADIILTATLIETAKHAPSSPFLIVGRRHDLDVTEPVDFSDPSWEKRIIEKATTEGKLHSDAGIDYFLFRKESYANPPPLIVGRLNWDNWMIWHARHEKLPIIDATKTIYAIHQNHGYPKGLDYGTRKAHPEGQHNLSFIPDRKAELTISGANWIMQSDYSLKKNLRIYFYPFKRLIRKITGR